MTKFICIACGILLAFQEASALSFVTVRVERNGTNTLFYCPEHSKEAMPLNEVTDTIAGSVRLDPDQTVRIIVGQGVPSEDFLAILSLYAKLGVSHVSLLRFGDAEEPTEFYLRVFQFQNGDHLGMLNFDEVRSMYIDGKPYKK